MARVSSWFPFGTANGVPQNTPMYLRKKIPSKQSDIFSCMEPMCSLLSSWPCAQNLGTYPLSNNGSGLGASPKGKLSSSKTLRSSACMVGERVGNHVMGLLVPEVAVFFLVFFFPPGGYDYFRNLHEIKLMTGLPVFHTTAKNSLMLVCAQQTVPI